MLCNGLSRDPDGRSTLAEVYGLPLLAELLSSSAPKVQLCGAAVLSLYGRTAKVSPGCNCCINHRCNDHAVVDATSFLGPVLWGDSGRMGRLTVLNAYVKARRVGMVAWGTHRGWCSWWRTEADRSSGWLPGC